MTRRSYLSRLAQPLTSADPVIWSTPRAAPEEARQAVPSIAHPTPTTQSATSTSTRTAIGKTARDPVSDLAQQPSLSTDMRTGSMTEARRALAVQRPSPHQPPGPRASMSASPVPVTVAAADLAGEPARAPQNPRENPRATAAEAAYTPAERRNDVGALERPAVSAATDRGSFAPERPAEAPSHIPSHTLRKRQEAAAISEPHSAPTSAVRKPEAPRLHIGAIEIRTSQPPATPPSNPPVVIAAPAAPAAATPIARGYASRFGLAQG